MAMECDWFESKFPVSWFSEEMAGDKSSYTRHLCYMHF